MLSCSIWLSAPSFWMDGGLESSCVGRTTYAAATTIHRQTRKTICCNSTSNAPDDGLMRPKHVEPRIRQYNYLVASGWHFTLFHEEDASSNNPKVAVRWNKLFLSFLRT